MIYFFLKNVQNFIFIFYILLLGNNSILLTSNKLLFLLNFVWLKIVGSI